MDQLTAHLDRGWDLAQHGDPRGAETSARQALEIDPNAPEVHNLLGYISALNVAAVKLGGAVGQSCRQFVAAMVASAD